MPSAANDERAAGEVIAAPTARLRSLAALVFARYDDTSSTWSPGWMRWPTGAGGALVTALLLVKLVITAWNCAVFDGLTYDQGALHVPRARTAGLGTSGRAYNPPLYYLGAAPALAWQTLRERLGVGDEVGRGVSPSKGASERGRRPPEASQGPARRAQAAQAARPEAQSSLFEEELDEGEPVESAGPGPTDPELAGPKRVGRGTPAGEGSNPDEPEASSLPALTSSSNDDADEAKRRRKAKDRQLLRALRWTNLGYLALFYVAWIGAILPRLIVEPRRAWLAMLVLLALPGYQKLAAMAHPDNALSAVTAVGIGVWLTLREDPRPVGWRVLWLALCAGLVALTRPFGVLPAAAFLVACGLLVAKDLGAHGIGAVGRVAACIALAGSLAMSWPTYQVVTQGRLSPVYKDSYLEPYLPYRPGFDRVGYFASFYPVELLTVPSRRLHDLDTHNDRFHNKYGNSFWTLLFSETWGEHWLYFSGRYQVENKLWAKRVMLAAALPSIPLLLVGLVRGVVASGRTIARWRREPDADKALFLVTFLGLGVIMYLYWHLGAGLTPGKNSSVKFIYNAYLYPVGLALCFLAPTSKFEGRVWPVYGVLLFVVSLPLVCFVPRWLLS